MALLNYAPSPTIIPQDFAAKNALALRGTTTGATGFPPKSAWWYDASGNKQTMPLTGELANATSVSSRNGSLVVNGPWGEKVFGSAGEAAKAGAASKDDEPPKFNLIAKDPEIDRAASAGLARVEAANTKADTMFGEALTEFKQRLNPARLDAELKTYDTAAGDLERSLATNLEEQRTGLAKARDLNLKQLLGNDERYSLMRGPLGTGRSGEHEKVFADSYYQAVLPYEQQLGALGRQNIGDVYASRLNTAPLGRNASAQYLSLLAEPTGRLLSMAGQQQANLNSAAGLLNSNRFSWSNDPLLTNQLPTPFAGYNLPGIPNYGGIRAPARTSNLMNYGGPTPPPNGGGGSNGGNGGNARQRSQAELLYERNFGSFPQDDPGFATDPNRRNMYVQFGGRIGQPANGFQPAYNPATKTWDDETNQRIDKAWTDQMWRGYVPPPTPGPVLGPPYDPILDAPQDFYPYNANFNTALYNSLNQNWNRSPDQREDQLDPSKFWQLENERSRLMLPYQGQDQGEFMVPQNAYDPNNLGSGY